MQHIAFHGSGVAIDTFRYEFTNQGNDQYGSGFYFTTDAGEALGYTDRTQMDLPKFGGSGQPTVHVVRLSFRNLLDAEDTRGLNRREVEQIIAASPELYDRLMDWDDVDSYGVEKVLHKAAGSFVLPNGVQSCLKSLHKLANDFYPAVEHIEAFNRTVEQVLGFDGVRVPWDGKEHLVAWFPEQIEICERIDALAPDCDKRLAEWQALAAAESRPRARARP